MGLYLVVGQIVTLRLGCDPQWRGILYDGRGGRVKARKLRAIALLTFLRSAAILLEETSLQPEKTVPVQQPISGRRAKS